MPPCIFCRIRSDGSLTSVPVEPCRVCGSSPAASPAAVPAAMPKAPPTTPVAIRGRETSPSMSPSSPSLLTQMFARSETWAQERRRGGLRELGFPPAELPPAPGVPGLEPDMLWAELRSEQSRFQYDDWAQIRFLMREKEVRALAEELLGRALELAVEAAGGGPGPGAGLHFEFGFVLGRAAEMLMHIGGDTAWVHPFATPRGAALVARVWARCCLVGLCPQKPRPPGGLAGPLLD